MADFHLLIILGILLIILLFSFLYFGNRICGFTTAHRELYRRKDYFSVQHQLLISNQQYMFCKNCKKIPRRLISCSTQTEPLPKTLPHDSENLSLHQLSSHETDLDLATQQTSSLVTENPRKLLSQYSCNLSTEQLKCLLKNDP